MEEDMYVPPQRTTALTPAAELASRLKPLIGQQFRLTGKTRTDGANLRKLVAATLASGKLPAAAKDDDWRCVPPKGKGVPSLLREYVDTYIVTSGDSYNLQVWNRNPASSSVQIEYTDGTTLLANQVRFVLVRIDTTSHRVRCVAVLSPDYIVSKFGKFGKPTVKQQLIITGAARQRVYDAPGSMVFFPDDRRVASRTVARADLGGCSFHSEPEEGRLLSMEAIRTIVASRVIGAVLQPNATKTRGQALEQLVASALGYKVSDKDVMIGGYPDVRHQALEVKVQDAPTVDLGRYSPQFEEDITGCTGFTSQSVRYLIALTDAATGKCRGVVLCPGARLGDHFTYVADESFKCQRSIPMAFFEQIEGKAVSNP